MPTASLREGQLLTSLRPVHITRARARARVTRYARE
jgi:hypothetical protein